MPRQRWVPNRGKQTAAPLSSERDRTRAELLHRKSSQCTQISPQGHHVRAPCPNKRRKDCVCHRGGSRFYPHTILNALRVQFSLYQMASTSSSPFDREKTVLLPDCTLQTNQSVKTKKLMMYSPGGTYIVARR